MFVYDFIMVQQDTFMIKFTNEFCRLKCYRSSENGKMENIGKGLGKGLSRPYFS